jgi:hypothetical protein
MSHMISDFVDSDRRERPAAVELLARDVPDDEEDEDEEDEETENEDDDGDQDGYSE